MSFVKYNYLCQTKLNEYMEYFICTLFLWFDDYKEFYSDSVIILLFFTKTGDKLHLSEIVITTFTFSKE